MPEATVYQCDKTEGLKGKHLKCGREVGDDGVVVAFDVFAMREYVEVDEPRPVRELSVQKFCTRRHANYWLIRQRVAAEA